MKKYLVLFITILLFNCSDKKQEKEIDPLLIGTWTGSEYGLEKEGMQKRWIQHRFKDGTYIIIFTTIEGNDVDSYAEKGKWWIEDKKFHEYNFIRGGTDIYNYKILDKDHIKFKAVKLTYEQTNPNYEFVDCKMIENF